MNGRDRGFGGRFIKGKKKRKRNTNELNMMQPPSITVGNQDLRPRDRSNSAPTYTITSTTETSELSIMRPPSPTINNNSNIALKPRGRSNSDPIFFCFSFSNVIFYLISCINSIISKFLLPLFC